MIFILVTKDGLSHELCGSTVGSRNRHGFHHELSNCVNNASKADSVLCSIFFSLNLLGVGRSLKNIPFISFAP